MGQVVDALAFEQHLAAGHAPGWLQQADDGGARQRFARARFAHHAEDFAGRDVERDVVQRAQRAAPAGEFDHQVLDLQKTHFLTRPYLRRGFSASRSQSPSRFTLRAISTSIRPGNTVIHHSPENR